MILVVVSGLIALTAIVASNYFDLIDMRKEQEQKERASA